jgi:hypothetical protein
LGTTQEYFCNVVDAFYQMASDSKSVAVVDTTAPAIACNAPASIVPADAPISFTATAEDVCDPGAGEMVSVIGYECFLMHKDRTIDKIESCEVVVDGATITILDVGGIGTHIRWTVTATDASGNTAIQDCELEVVKPTK